jgi:hypothetical protein
MIFSSKVLNQVTRNSDLFAARYSEFFSTLFKSIGLKNRSTLSLVKHLSTQRKITGLSLNKFLITHRFQHTISKEKATEEKALTTSSNPLSSVGVKDKCHSSNQVLGNFTLINIMTK